MASATPRARLEVICGPMFATKTGSLILALRRHKLGSKKTLLIKNVHDTRYNSGPALSISHDGAKHEAISFPNIDAVPNELLEGVDVIGIDEGQFMGPNLAAWCVAQVSAPNHRTVIVACLDTDYTMKPFSNVGPLICVADSVTKTTAICGVRGDDAHFTRRILGGSELVEIGAYSYMPTCRDHHGVIVSESPEQYQSRIESIIKGITNECD